MTETIIWWAKRDLRIADNPALHLAAMRGGVVLPLYIAEPDIWGGPDYAARQWRFVAESLEGLRADLAALGAPLILRRGEACAVFEALRREVGFSAIVAVEETGNGATFARDRRVAAWARGAGVAFIETPQTGVIRALPSRDGWARARDAALRAKLLPAPKALAPHGVEIGAIPDAGDLGLGFDPCPARQKGGRARAEAALAVFLDDRAARYRAGMSSPLTAPDLSSRLSPYLAHGVISTRQVLGHLKGARPLAPQDKARAFGIKSFVSRLAWRDHFMQKLESQPSIETRCLHSAYETLRPQGAAPDRVAAWAAGQTGIPFVDANMRCLIETGWLPFRMRAMLVSVATHHLWLDWRDIAAPLARLFTDYEAGIHYPQLQMQSGSTGINTIRIYNPIKQAQDHDAGGQFTRRYCPELRDLPGHVLQTPWAWAGARALLGKRYPAPLVDPVAAARVARQRLWALRGGADFAQEAATIVARHASRATGAGAQHFVNDRAKPRPRAKAKDAQLRLEL